MQLTTDEIIKAVLFHQTSTSVNFKLPRDIRLPDEKTSLIFASAYLVPGTLAIYYHIRVIESVWMHLVVSFFFWKEHLVLCQEAFSKKCMNQRWIGSLISLTCNSLLASNQYIFVECLLIKTLHTSVHFNLRCDSRCGFNGKSPQTKLCRENSLGEQFFRGNSFGM